MSIFVVAGCFYTWQFLNYKKLCMDTTINHDLVIKNSPADLVFLAAVHNYDESTKTIMILIESTHDWSGFTGHKESVLALGFFGVLILNAIEYDINVHYVIFEYHQIINGVYTALGKQRPFLKDRKRFRQAKLNRDGSVEFLDEF